MTTTPADPVPQAGGAPTLHLTDLLRRPLTDRQGETIGRLSDVIVRLRGAENPVMKGLVAAVGGREVYVPAGQVTSLGGDAVKLSSAKLDLRGFERRHGEVLLRADVLGHRLIDVESAHLIKAADLEIEQQAAGSSARARPASRTATSSASGPGSSR
jgi:sporulation protein YlmC with PRC-barrel domain